MGARVVTVKRHENLGFAERTYLPAILKGLATTSRHFFHNLGGWLSGKPHRLRRAVPRGARRLSRTRSAACRCWSQLENGLPKCVACGLCEFACPTDCITIVPGELPEHGIERYPEAFDIDMSRCMFCGLCEEACPEEAIVMSREVELATYDRGSMLYDKADAAGAREPAEAPPRLPARRVRPQARASRCRGSRRDGRLRLASRCAS